MRRSWATARVCCLIVNRQHYLETAIEWNNYGDVAGYMRTYQHGTNVKHLWLYIPECLAGVVSNLPRAAQGDAFGSVGLLYNRIKDAAFDPADLETRVRDVMLDNDVTNNFEIYTFHLTGDEKNRSIRSFTDKQKLEVHERQEGTCRSCEEHLELSRVPNDHKMPGARMAKLWPTTGPYSARPATARSGTSETRSTYAKKPFY